MKAGKRVIAAAAAVLIASQIPAHAGKVGSDCSYNGIRLYGKVKVVDSFPDIKVQVVDSFPDLKVKQVSSFADSCGEWQIVDDFPDFKIKYVSSFPDIKIKMVSSFPGTD